MGIKLTQDEVVRRIKETHGDTYDLSKFVYTTQRSKSIFICKIHGEFLSQPKEVWGGTGCPECGKEKFVKPMSKWEDVVKKLTETHGDEYKYFPETYKGVSKKIKVKCKIHNHIWNVRVMDLIKGEGCPKCRYVKSSEKLVLKVPEFIKRSRETHGNKYDYSKVHQFKRQKTEGVVIICPNHGEFNQKPYDHYSGSGCPKCWEEIRSEIMTTPWEEVLKSFIEVHKEEYEYCENTYTNSNEKMEIICKKHGVFLQTPTNHKQGNGCPVCRSSTGEKEITHLLNDLEVEFEHQKKYKKLGRKRFDFFIPSINTIVEYNGIQHYEPIEHFGGIKSLKNTQKRDKIKKQYCLDNGINYEIIRYDEDTKLRVLEILEKYHKS
jgi:hypothetical protein